MNPWELEKQDIACIPLTVMFGDREYQENVNLSKEQFYDLLAKEEGAPKTAQASPAVVGELFRQARQKGEEAVYITLSAALSGTYQGACMAREMAGKTGIYVVDSKNATGGQRLLVEYAVRLRDEGKPASEIAAGVEDLRDRIVLYACIDTLEYLYHGGRISHTAYKIGTLAQVKPIIRVSQEGKVEGAVQGHGNAQGDGLSVQVPGAAQTRPGASAVCDVYPPTGTMPGSWPSVLRKWAIPSRRIA